VRFAVTSPNRGPGRRDKTGIFWLQMQSFSQLRDKGKHYVFNLKQNFQYFSKTTINFVLDFLRTRISRRFYENFNWISFSILTDVTILFSALTHIIHKPTFAP